MPFMPTNPTPWQSWLIGRMAAMGLSTLLLADQMDRCRATVSGWRSTDKQLPPGTCHQELALLLGVPQIELSRRIADEKKRRAEVAVHAEDPTAAVSA